MYSNPHPTPRREQLALVMSDLMQAMQQPRSAATRALYAETQCDSCPGYRSDSDTHALGILQQDVRMMVLWQRKNPT